MSWISTAIIYQVNLRSLAAREPRNAAEAADERPPAISPLAYLARNLRKLQKLGFTVLYLMPPYPVGDEGRKGIGSPYSIRDFHSIDPEYGTLEDFEHLLRHAHALDLKVILDITPNHTSLDHTWTREHPDGYVKREDGSLFHDFDWSDTAKLDYRNPDLRRAMIETYDYWLGLLGEKGGGVHDGVDGFRLDMAHCINDTGFWNEAIPELRDRHPTRELLFLAESYGTRNNLDLFGRGINAAYDDDLYKIWTHAYAVGPEGSVVSLSPDAEENPEFSDSLAAFCEGGIAGAVLQALTRYEEVLPPGEEGPWLARYTDNHDEGRGVYRFGEGAVRAAMRLVFLAPRTIPFLLTGQEFGAVNRPSIHERFGACNKGRRTCSRAHEGVEDHRPAAAATEIREEPGIEFEGNLFARGREERKAWYEFYRELIALRGKAPALARGSFAVLDAGEQADPSARTVVAFARTSESTTVHCAVNLGPDARRLQNATLFKGKALYGGLDDGVLGPFEAIVTRAQRSARSR